MRARHVSMAEALRAFRDFTLNHVALPWVYAPTADERM